MSFFCDVFDSLGLEDDAKNLSISYIDNRGVVVVGKFKVLSLSDQLVCIRADKKSIEIAGENMIIKTMAKGELVLVGKILNIDFGGKHDK